jgi:hypothetical protein
MTTFGERLDAAAGATTCQILSSGGSALVGFGAVSLVTGGGVVPLALGSAALLAANYGCPWDPSQPPTWEQNSYLDGCTQIADGYGWLQAATVTTGFEWIDLPPANYANADQTISLLSVEYKLQENGRYTEEISYVTTSGVRLYRQFDIYENQFQGNKFRIRPITGTCDKTETPGPTIPPTTYTDPETGCQLVVNTQGLTLDGSGNVRPVFKIEPGTDGTRNGGVIGGCNFAPIIYVGGPYGPTAPGGPTGPGGPGGPTWGPWNPDWDDGGGGGVPPWVPTVIDLVAPFVPYIVSQVLAPFVETTYPTGTREIYAACNYKENGDPETFSVTYPEENYQERVLTSLDAIVDFQQQILLWRTPTCATSSPKIGDYRTISFISDEQSPNGKSRLAKRFRYRSSSGLGLDGVVNHWKDFTWSAGPVCVQHRDTQLGAPQVWASSIDEGKRVIRHAAAEAGIDPDQAGRWEVSGSDNPRYGLPGTMRVNTQGGYYWITSRLGPDQRPLVAET